MDKELFKKELLKFSLLFPEKTIEPKIYWDLLKNIPNDDFIAAVRHICINVKEIYKSTNLVALMFEHIRNNKLISAENAWKEVLDEISRVGSYGEPVFSNKLIDESIRLNGGWKKLCSSIDIHWDKKRFCNTLEELQNEEDINYKVISCSQEQLKIKKTNT